MTSSWKFPQKTPYGVFLFAQIKNNKHKIPLELIHNWQAFGRTKNRLLVYFLSEKK